VAARHQTEIVAGLLGLLQGNLLWLVLAAVLTTGFWVAGTAAQLGAVRIRPRLGRMFAVQVAAGAVNQVVPGGVGGMAVNIRFLEREGMSRAAAVAAVGLNSVAGLVTHVVLIAALWAFVPAALPLGLSSSAAPVLSGPAPSVQELADVSQAAALVAAAALAVLASAVSANRGWPALLARLRSRAGRLVDRAVVELRDLRTVLRSPGRAVLLWVGSAASPVLHVLILVAVGHSLSAGVGLLPVALAFLVASGVAAVLPSPGGLGALDITLTAALVAVGLPTPTAIAVVLGYRLVTVWLPLLPGALVFGVLLRRRVL
jgi:uncharacterized membrane protein YbhN (UPF0104 family)